jgi:hypothetical protein
MTGPPARPWWSRPDRGDRHRPGHDAWVVVDEPVVLVDVEGAASDGDA